ncbi:LuxR C-terminal-related transcriptional regulator [Deinococcus rubellus]|uniref:LuxR C-terminal-related transcriptional regulator n=1 Tax=Deinococcus rubellus TaxID=1889240 RepID=UPI003CD0B0DA
MDHPIDEGSRAEGALQANTVKSHVSSLLAKLEAKNRTHAVARGRALGLLESKA